MQCIKVPYRQPTWTMPGRLACAYAVLWLPLRGRGTSAHFLHIFSLYCFLGRHDPVGTVICPTERSTEGPWASWSDYTAR